MIKKSAKSRYLICKNTQFFSMIDENVFFEWIKKLDFIEKVKKVSNDFFIFLNKKTLREIDLYEILYLFKRYNIDMKQLRPFLNKRNSKIFFKSKDAYWFKPLFGEK